MVMDLPSSPTIDELARQADAAFAAKERAEAENVEAFTRLRRAVKDALPVRRGQECEALLVPLTLKGAERPYADRVWTRALCHDVVVRRSDRTVHFMVARALKGGGFSRRLSTAYEVRPL